MHAMQHCACVDPAELISAVNKTRTIGSNRHAEIRWTDETCRSSHTLNQLMTLTRTRPIARGEHRSLLLKIRVTKRAYFTRPHTDDAPRQLRDGRRPAWHILQTACSSRNRCTPYSGRRRRYVDEQVGRRQVLYTSARPMSKVDDIYERVEPEACQTAARSAMATAHVRPANKAHAARSHVHDRYA